jgi:HAD superfamily hydrolase (TIGR01509 family)
MAVIPSPKAIVFDCDGLLVDTQRSWTRAEVALARRYGKDIDQSEQAALVGASVESAALALASKLQQPKDRLSEELEALLHKFTQEDAELLPGAKEVITAVRGRIPVAVASNGPRRVLEGTLSASGLRDVFAVAIGADDVSHGKPAPDLYARACELLGIAPRDALAFEDSAIGVSAAKSAGLTVIGVSSYPADVRHADIVAPSLLDKKLWSCLPFLGQWPTS